MNKVNIKLAFVVLLLIPGTVSAATLAEKFDKDYIPLGSATLTVSMTIVDFDSDGKMDGVAAIDSNGGRVLAFGFSGPGQMWSIKTPEIRAGNSDGVVVAADLDGDGKLSDVIAGSKGVYAINSGTVMWNFITKGSIYSLSMVDLNGDGKANEIVAGGDKNVYALDASGVSLWNFTDPSGTVGSISGIDFDKDGVPESILLGSAKVLYVLDSEGKRVWSRIASDIVYSVIAVDFDNDGYLTDIVVGSGDGNVTALNSEGESLWDYRAYVEPGNKIKLHVADLSSVGIFDKVIVNADMVHALNAVGTRAWPNTLAGDAVALIDFNGDGKMEGVVTGTSTRIYAINPAGQQVGYYLRDDDKKEDPYNITGASTLSAADLDGDGYLDDIIGVGSGAFFALAHTTDAPAPTVTPTPETTPPPLMPGNVTVEIGEDKSVTENTLVTLTAEATPRLPNGSIFSYRWTEGTDILGEEKTLSKIFSEGEHEIKVEVIDNTGAKASDTVKVTVTAQASPTPTAAPPAEETSPLMMVLLGVAIGVIIVGVILYFMKRQGPEEDWAK